jgi:hypothetical protein
MQPVIVRRCTRSKKLDGHVQVCSASSISNFTFGGTLHAINHRFHVGKKRRMMVPCWLDGTQVDCGYCIDKVLSTCQPRSLALTRSARKLLACINRPYTGSGAYIQNLLGVFQRREDDFVFENELQRRVLDV